MNFVAVSINSYVMSHETNGNFNVLPYNLYLYIENTDVNDCFKHLYYNTCK